MTFPRISGDFAPLFHLLDDYEVHRSACPKNKTTTRHSFSPRFDVYELNDCYHLDGELPGVDQSHIDIEFTDPTTLVVKGHADRGYSKTITRDEPVSRSRQPTVEDENDDATSTASTPSTPSNQSATEKRPEETYKYWATERPVGDFHRTFSFPTRVDQDSVRATLRNGILSLVVPKEPAPQLKKIRVE